MQWFGLAACNKEKTYSFTKSPRQLNFRYVFVVYIVEDIHYFFFIHFYLRGGVKTQRGNKNSLILILLIKVEGFFDASLGVSLLFLLGGNLRQKMRFFFSSLPGSHPLKILI